MKRKFFKFFIFILWAAAIGSAFWILNLEEQNRKPKFKGFNTQTIGQKFELNNERLTRNGLTVDLSAKLKNTSKDDLIVEKAIFYFYNDENKLIKSKDLTFGNTKNHLIKSNETWPIKFSVAESNCLSLTAKDTPECLSVDDYLKFEFKYFTADVFWSKELRPDFVFNAKKVDQTHNFISNLKIERLEQSYNYNETAKLTYRVNGKVKTIYGNFGDMSQYNIFPQYRDIDNDNIDEVILVNNYNADSGMNYLIMKLNGEELEPVNVVTETRDEFGDNVKREYNDSGLKSLEIADANSDDLVDLKSFNSKTSETEVYYWNEREGIHIRKVMVGVN